MAKGLGSFGGATLERSKMQTHQKVQTNEPKVDNSGGGGNIGKNIFNGGGGDGDDGDDDDYSEGFGDGDGDDSVDKFIRTVIQQLYTKEAVEAVLQEWFRSIVDLPAIIRQSVAMGLFSSAQLVRFLSMDVRPNVTRAVTRTMPPSVSMHIYLSSHGFCLMPLSCLCLLCGPAKCVHALMYTVAVYICNTCHASFGGHAQIFPSHVSCAFRISFSVC